MVSTTRTVRSKTIGLTATGQKILTPLLRFALSSHFEKKETGIPYPKDESDVRPIGEATTDFECKNTPFGLCTGVRVGDFIYLKGFGVFFIYGMIIDER